MKFVFFFWKCARLATQWKHTSENVSEKSQSDRDTVLRSRMKKNSVSFGLEKHQHRRNIDIFFIINLLVVCVWCVCRRAMATSSRSIWLYLHFSYPELVAIGDYFWVAINEWMSWYSRAKLFMTHLIFYVVCATSDAPNLIDSSFVVNLGIYSM